MNDVPVTGVNVNSTPQNLEQTTDVTTLVASTSHTVKKVTRSTDQKLTIQLSLPTMVLPVVTRTALLLTI